MESAGNIWLDRPLVAVEFYVPELLSPTLGVACLTRDGFLGTQAFALSEDGAVMHGPTLKARRIENDAFLSVMLFRAYYYESLTRLEKNKIRRALCAAIADRFWHVHHSFMSLWPECLRDACEIFAGAMLDHSMLSVAWEIDEENPFRFPIHKKHVVLCRHDNSNSGRPGKRRMVRLTRAAAQQLEGVPNVSELPFHHGGQLRAGV